jgi:hypothetical protein
MITEIIRLNADPDLEDWVDVEEEEEAFVIISLNPVSPSIALEIDNKNTNDDRTARRSGTLSTPRIVKDGGLHGWTSWECRSTGLVQ